MPVTRVLLDLGGVLTADPWQALLLTPRRGLVDRLGLNRDAVTRAANDLWEIHAKHRTDEQTYWREMSERIGADVSVSAESEAELLVTLPGARSAVRFLSDARIPWGLITNNTAFWYEKQLAILNLTADQLTWSFTSFASGCQKGDARGLFDLAAVQIDPSTTLVVDDREENVERARSLRFIAERIPEGESESLMDLLRDKVNFGG